MDENERFTTKRQRLQVIVNIIQVQLFENFKGKTMVKVLVGKQKKIIFTKAKKVDCPYHNQHCLFNLFLPLTTLVSKKLVAKVYKWPKSSKKLAGEFTVDLFTIWAQPNHRFIEKWVALIDTKNPCLKVTGYLKCDIVMVRKGEAKTCCGGEKEYAVDKVDGSEFKENVPDLSLMPHCTMNPTFQTRLVFCVYRADSFTPPHIRPFVRITFGGKVLKTTVTKTDTWNEELAFFNSNSSFYENIFIEICDGRKIPKKKIVGNTNIRLTNLCETTENGFLPTFGPTFLYLYEPLKKTGRHCDYSPLYNSFTFSCRLLIAIRTETATSSDACNQVEKKKKSKKCIPSICPLNECLYFNYQKFILFAVIFDVIYFDKSLLANVAIRMTIGPKKSTIKLTPSSKIPSSCLIHKRPLENPQKPFVIASCNETPHYRLKNKEGCSFVAFGGKFPCLHVYGEWPDSMRKIYRSNVINKAIQNCTKEVDKIKSDMKFDEITAKESSNKLKQLLTNLSKSCEVILLLTNVITLEDTNLAREKKRVYHEEISDIVKKTKLASTANRLIAGDELRKISAYLRRLQKYAKDPENSFPDTEIWVLKGGKIAAQIRIKTEDITYSPNYYQRGSMSGKTQTLIIRGKKEKIKGKMDVFLWFGLAEDFMQCLDMLPQGYKNFSRPKCSVFTDNRIPTGIMYTKCHEFLCHTNIYCAKILPEESSVHLPNPFAKVIILGQSRCTHVKKATFCPIWKETLVISQVRLYGLLEEIEKNTITITIEIYDRKSTKKKLIGRSFVKPVFKLGGNFPDVCSSQFQWENILKGTDVVGQILMSSELWLNSCNILKKDSLFPTPESILPPVATFRLEVLFWGVREMIKKPYLRNKVFATVKCGDKLIKSQILKNVRKKLNFPGRVQCMELELPEQLEFAPPLSLKLYHLTSFMGVRKGIATCTVSNVRSFCKVLQNDQNQTEITHVKFDNKCQQEKPNHLKLTEKTIRHSCRAFRFSLIDRIKYCKRKFCPAFNSEPETETCEDTDSQLFTNFEVSEIASEGDLSWWGKYYASLGIPADSAIAPPLRIYQKELELQPEFNEFTDFLHKFNMFIKKKWKRKEDDILVAKVKAALTMYKVVCESKENCSMLLMKSPSNDTFEFLVRVYIINGKNLRYRRVNCSLNPYLILKLGKQEISDENDYVLNRVNPMFAKCFEIWGKFPQDHLLQIRVMERGLRSKDKIIGETTIDLENRYYSRHHATCGISKIFEKKGLNPWRDIQPPTQILQNLCTQLDLNQPIYKPNAVVIEGNVFKTSIPSDSEYLEENQALAVLRGWHEIATIGYHMVPEHVETRSLYRPQLPGIEQGKLEMWVDIFPADTQCMPPMVDIKLGCATPMELRAIVWNVDGVLLEEDSCTCSKKMSGIYVKGWICSLEEDVQRTDTDSEPINGKGSFNWRFVFRFNYIPSERMMTVKKKSNRLGDTCNEQKYHCKLEMQIRDNDTFGDDYLGTLLLELCSMPCGAKRPNRCTLKMLSPNAAKINLFKIGKVRGWWPFRRLKEKRFELTGKIDLELEVLTKTEASLNPAGKGRNGPNGLPFPKRTARRLNKNFATSIRMLGYPVKKYGKITVGTVLVIVLIITLIIVYVIFR